MSGFGAFGELAFAEALVPVVLSVTTAFSAEGFLATLGHTPIPVATAFVAAGIFATRAKLVPKFYDFPIGRHLWNDYGRRASQIRYRGGRF